MTVFTVIVYLIERGRQITHLLAVSQYSHVKVLSTILIKYTFFVKL